MHPYPRLNQRSLVHDAKSPLQSAREVNDAGTAVLPVGQVTTLLGGENLAGSDPGARDEPEPPRFLWRLLTLRGWSYGNSKEMLAVR